MPESKRIKRFRECGLMGCLNNSKDNMEWIRVEDKLPENLGWYLVYTNEGKIEILRFEGKVGVVTHWMEIPKEPKEKDGMD
jgi:hypothetical protein